MHNPSTVSQSVTSQPLGDPGDHEFEAYDCLEIWLRNDDPGSPSQDTDVHADTDIVPAQSPSVLGTIQCAFANSTGTERVNLSLAVDASPGCGGIAWPAGEVLATYLVNRGSKCLRDKIVVELGSGTGLVGLVAAAQGSRVWITDQAPLLNIMQHNVSMNGLEENVRVEELNWGEPIRDSIPQPDLVLVADCVYFEPAFAPLVETLKDLVRDGPPEILFCYKKRRKADKRFFGILKKYFVWDHVTDDPNRDAYAREGIYLFTLARRSSRS